MKPYSMHEFRVTQDHLGTQIVLTISHPDGTQEYEGSGSNLYEALTSLADEYSDRTGE
jgi:hypothetical protein